MLIITKIFFLSLTACFACDLSYNQKVDFGNNICSVVIKILNYEKSKIDIWILDEDYNEFNNSNTLDVINCVLNGLNRDIVIKFNKFPDEKPFLDYENLSHDPKYLLIFKLNLNRGYTLSKHLQRLRFYWSFIANNLIFIVTESIRSIESIQNFSSDLIDGGTKDFIIIYQMFLIIL